MIGILYYINDKEYITYHPNKGFKVLSSQNRIDKNIIWISNLKDIKQSNIKKEDFFNIKFKEIIYFFNIDKLNAPEQFKFITKLFNSIIEIFKEEYSFLNLKTDDLKKIDNFSDILFKSKINLSLPESNKFNFNNISDNFNKEIEFKKVSSSDFFISYFDSYDFIKDLFEIKIPTGDFEIYTASEYSKNSDPFKVMNTIPKETCFFMKCEAIEDIFIKKYFPEKGKEAWFTNLELLFLRGKCELKLNEVIIFKNSLRLKDLIRIRFKSKYLNFAFEIFILNLIKSIKKNNIDLINIWTESYEKIYFLEKTLELEGDNIEIGYFFGNKILIAIDDIKKIDVLENNNLMYPIKLVRYILNN